jgi:hypothetical protein
MAEFIVFKAGLDQPTEMVFTDTLENACNLKVLKEQDGFDWEIAEVLPQDNWVFKLYRWFHRRLD